MKKNITKITGLILCCILLISVCAALAACEKKEFTVTFDYNYAGAPAAETKTVVDGGTVSAPTTDPVRSGYEFKGWFKDKLGATKYTFSDKVTGNLTLYAHWLEEAEVFTVTFDYNYTGSPAAATKDVTYGNTVSRPNAPTRANFTFVDWYTEEEEGTVYSFSTAVTSSFTLYAHWTQNYVTFTVNYNYPGAEPDVYSMKSGDKFEEPEDPEREDDTYVYEFTGWCTDTSGSKLYNFDNQVTQNTTIYARWEIAGMTYYTVTLNYNYTGAPEALTQRVAAGEAAIEPDAAQILRDRYDFTGWYTDPDCEVEYDFETVVNDDITLYAGWEEWLYNSYTFEAECTDLTHIEHAPGWSGHTDGVYVIMKDSQRDENAEDPDEYLKNFTNSSGGYYVSYLYREGLGINFVIQSDRDVDDARLTLRLSAEQIDPYTMNDEDFTVTVNGNTISYDPITFTGVPGLGDNYKLFFKDYLISTTLSLKKGENIISLTTTNEKAEGLGTMESLAPMVDCIKIDTSAILTWEPDYDFINWIID